MGEMRRWMTGVPGGTSRAVAGAGHRARVVLAALTLLTLMWRPAWPAGDVAVEVDEHDDTFRVRGAFIVAVPRDVVWDVLTDYGHIGSFVRSIRASQVERHDGQIILHQDAWGGVFPFRRSMHVELDVHEEPERRIAFRDRSGRDFRQYSGEWIVAVDSAVVSVAYAVDARPRTAVPHMIARGLLSGSAQSLLAQVRAEMLRRCPPGRDQGRK
jgi:hypothetical protein